MSAFVATPAYGPLDPRAAMSFAGLMQHLGSGAQWVVEAFNPNQAQARNRLMHQFLASGAERMVCIDKDSVFSPSDVEALLAVDEDAVSALYKPRVHIGEEYVGQPLNGGEKRGALLEMKRVGLGLLVLSRRFCTTLSDGVPTFDGGIPEVFAARVIDGQYTSMDYVISDRWRSLGGRIWLHTGVRIGHVGAHVFV